MLEIMTLEARSRLLNAAAPHHETSALEALISVNLIRAAIRCLARIQNASGPGRGAHTVHKVKESRTETDIESDRVPAVHSLREAKGRRREAASASCQGPHTIHTRHLGPSTSCNACCAMLSSSSVGSTMSLILLLPFWNSPIAPPTSFWFCSEEGLRPLTDTRAVDET